MSFIFCILMLQHLRLWWQRRDCQFLEIIKYLPTRVRFIHKLNNLQSMLPTALLTRLAHSRLLSTCPITPEPGIRQLGTVPTSQSPLTLLNPASPKPAYPASPIPFCRNHNRGSCLCFPLTPSASWWTLCPLQHHGPHGGMACPLLLGSVSNKRYFQWQSSPDLWPSHSWIIIKPSF